MLRVVHLVGRNRTFVYIYIYISGDKPYSPKMNWSGTYGHLIWSNVLSRLDREKEKREEHELKKKRERESDSGDCLETTLIESNSLDRVQVRLPASESSSSSSPFFFVEIKKKVGSSWCGERRKKNQRGASSYTHFVVLLFHSGCVRLWCGYGL